MHPQKQSTHWLPRLGPRSLAPVLAAALLGSALIVSTARAENEEMVRTAGSVSYVSGGVGTESIDQLNSLARDFNLKLVFAMKSGEFLSGVKVAIADAKGKPVLDDTSDGPWLLAKLPAGNYRVSASFGGDEVTQKIQVGADKLKVAYFRWASE
jgi:hypothetical protein